MADYGEEFLLESGQVEKVEVIKLTEEVTINDDTFENEHTYWRVLSTGEFYAPFDNPDHNLDLDYSLYKTRNNLLQTEEIIEIRKYYGLSQRSFGKILGIGYSTISRMENDTIQSQVHDTIYRFASDPAAFFNKIVLPKNELLSDEDKQQLFSRLSRTLDDLSEIE